MSYLEALNTFSITMTRYATHTFPDQMLLLSVLSTVRIQGEKHQKEESQHCRVSRWRQGDFEEKEKGELTSFYDYFS